MGTEHILPEGSCILAANHFSFWDPVFLACSVRQRKITFLSKKSLFDSPLIGFLLCKIGSVPVERQGSDLSAMRTAISVLKEQKLIAIYPQGTRQPDRNPRATQFQGGAAFLALHSGAPIIPVGIATRDYHAKLFRQAAIVFGEPIVLNAGDRTKQALAEATVAIQKAICDTADEALKLAGKAANA